MSVTQNTAKTKKRKTAVQPGSRAYGAIVLALAFGLACVVTLTSLTPKRYEVSVGNAAKEAITAPRMVEDSAITEALRQAARNKVSAVYAVDDELADTLISGAQSFFSALKSFRNAATDIRATTAPTPWVSARQARRSTNGSSSGSSEPRPRRAIATSQPG